MHFYKRGTGRKESLSAEEEKYIKFTAYDALIEFDANQLPVFPEFIQIIDSTIFIFPMQYVARKEGHHEGYFSTGGKGIVIYVRNTGHYIMLYDEQLTPEEIRWTISKLLYLIKSGDLENRPNVFHYADKGERIAHCNSFAYQFTCPDVVLKACGIQEADEIIQHCKIPFTYANIKSRLLKMATNSKSLQFAEKILKKSFSAYISSIRQNPGTISKMECSECNRELE